MKTGIYYYNHYLSAEERHYFSLNLKQSGIQEWEYLDRSFEDFSKFLSKGFIWILTPQGHYYWALVETRNKFYPRMLEAMRKVFENEFYDFPDERINAMLEFADEYIQENVKPYQTIKIL